MITLKSTCETLIAMALLTGIAISAQAAPVTLAFEAEITGIPIGIPYESGVDFAIGDIIYGELTYEFESSSAMSLVSQQPHRVVLAVNNVRLETSEYEVQVFDNTPILDFPPSSLIDTLSVFGDGLVVTHSDQPTVVDASRSAFNFSMFAPADVLSLAALPVSHEQWNDFTLQRHLSLRLENGIGGVVGFGAAVDNFTLIPEPSSVGITAFLVSLLIYPRRGSR